jgi:hypothetical protein
LKNKSGKTEELILRFSALLLILQGLPWGRYKRLYLKKEASDIDEFKILLHNSEFVEIRK